MNEVWKPVKNYEGLYEVSNLGRVRSLNRLEIRGAYRREHFGRILRQSSNLKYRVVGLSKNGICKTSLVHRLVANAFIPNVYGKPQVNHIDENPLNNNVCNLEWMTSKENSNWATAQLRKVLTQDYESVSRKLKKILIQYDENMNEIARWSGLLDMCKVTGYNKDNVSESCLGKRKTLTYGCYWRYEQ